MNRRRAGDRAAGGLSYPRDRRQDAADAINRAIRQERTFATLCTSFALLAVAIACGLYGMMAYNVARRTNEIGLRAPRVRSRISTSNRPFGQPLLRSSIASPRYGSGLA